VKSRTARDLKQQPPDTPSGLLSVFADQQDSALLESIVKSSGWQVFTAGSIHEATQILHRNDVSIVLCDHILPDGSWKLILGELRDLPHMPALIVASTLADDALWAEVLNMGAYDLLAKPLRADEVLRTIDTAPRLRLAASA